MKYLHQKGDTIVEVIIAMAVLSLILGGAYASARHSLNATIQAHEHSTALKIAEGQLEKLKYLSEQTPIFPATELPIYDTGLFSYGEAFCVSDTMQVVNPATTGTGKLFAASATTFASYNTNCKKTINLDYYLTIGRSPSNIFTVYVRWDNIHGTGLDQVTLAYKLDK